VDGHRAEFKNLNENTESAAYNAIRGSNRQHVEHVYILVRDGVEIKSVEAGRDRWLRQRTDPPLKFIQVLDGGAGWQLPMQSTRQPLK
jgi:hypothetical protein